MNFAGGVVAECRRRAKRAVQLERAVRRFKKRSAGDRSAPVMGAGVRIKSEVGAAGGRRRGIFD